MRLWSLTMPIFLTALLLVTLISMCLSLFAMAFEAALVCIAVGIISFLTWRIKRDTTNRSTSD